MTDAEELQGMETAERQHAQAPVLQETVVEAIFLEENYRNSLKDLQDPVKDSQLEEAWPEALELMAQTVTASTLTTCSFE